MTILAKSTDSRVGYQSINNCTTTCAIHDDLPQWDTLSMGMSADIEAAINAGATMIRVGTDCWRPHNLGEIV